MRRRDDGVVRRRLADRGDRSHLDRGPLLRIVEHRLVQHLEEDAVRIRLRVVAGKRAPQRAESDDSGVIGAEPALELVGGMDVDDDAQAILQHGVHGSVELSDECRIQAAGRSIAQQLVAIDAEPHMVEAHGVHQRNVVGCGIAAQPRG